MGVVMGVVYPLWPATIHNNDVPTFIQEEREVLSSIYDSDECFKQQNDTTFTYRVLYNT